jgi:general secretion pathway protein C
MLARLCAFVIWALVAASAVFWGLRLLVRAPAAPPNAVAVGDAAAVRVDLTRLLGAAPVAAPLAVAVAEASARFRLIGIMAPKASTAAGHRGGVALIAVDGRLPKAYAVGSSLDGDLVLQSVSLRTAAIGPSRGAATVTLELPPLPAAATGTLPSPVAGFAPAGVAPGAPARFGSPMAVPPLVTPQGMPLPPAGGGLQISPAAPPPLRDPSGLPTQ